MYEKAQALQRPSCRKVRKMRAAKHDHRVAVLQTSPWSASLPLPHGGPSSRFGWALCSHTLPPRDAAHLHTPSGLPLHEGKYLGVVFSCRFCFFLFSFLNHNSKQVGSVSIPSPQQFEKMCTCILCRGWRDIVLINMACFCLFETCFPRFNLVFRKFLNYIPTYK